MVYFAQYPSPVGVLLLTAQDGFLTGLWMGSLPPAGAEERPECPVLKRTAAWLDGYFRGDVLPVDIPLAPKGTAFQLQVWQILLTIPFGEVTTYGQLAREMGKRTGKETMSAQAIGQAVGKNPISILIPCHRVVGAGGKLTGYAGGLERKQWLLHHEGWQREETPVGWGLAPAAHKS